MTEYIKREDAIKAVTWLHDEFLPIDGVVDDIESVPAADVVEVVRCKDCVKANADSDERYMYCTKCHEYKLIDYYCAEGRRGDG